MKHQSNLALQLDPEEIHGRLGLAFNPKGPKPLTVYIVFWFDEDDALDKQGKPILHVSKVFLEESHAVEYIKDNEQFLNLVWEAYPISQ